MRDRLDHVFIALSHPVRREMLRRLGKGQMSVSTLAAPFDITSPAVTKHLQVLIRAGLIVQGREGIWRPCELVPQALDEVWKWLAEHQRLESQTQVGAPPRETCPFP